MLAACGPAFAQDRVADRAGNTNADREIIVYGQRSGEVQSDIRPIGELDEQDIGAFAAGTIGELLGALVPQTRGAAGTSPVFLVNGKPIGSVSEINSLPPEALLTVQIFPEDLAPLYGSSADKRVVNLVLKKDYRAITTQLDATFPTEGAANEIKAEIALTRIAGEQRWNFGAEYIQREALFESDRPIVGGMGSRQTLLPKREHIKLNGTWSDYVSSDVQIDVSASFNAGQSTGRIANSAVTPDSAFPFLENRRNSRSANLAVSGNGMLGGWDWFASGSVDYAYLATRVDPRTTLSASQGRTTTAQTINIRGSSLFNGTLISLSAGDISSSLEFFALKESIKGRSEDMGRVERSRGNRTSGGAKMALTVPLTGPGFLDDLGRFSAQFEGGVEELSDSSALVDYGYGLRWAPNRSIQFSAFWSRDESAPGISDLSDPQIQTPDVVLFDFVRGESAIVDLLDGGNPALKPENAKSMRLSLAVRPETLPDLSLNAAYVRRGVDNAITSLTVASPEVAAAFPDRFIRDQAGRLEQFDIRPVNAGRSVRENANWTLSWSQSLNGSGRADDNNQDDERSKASASGVILLSLDHRVLLSDQRVFAPGGSIINNLDGSAEGTSRHQIAFTAKLLYEGIGINVDLNWASGYDVVTGGQKLDYSPLASIDLKIFANLGEVIGRKNEVHWTNGLRVALTIGNIFNSRRRIVDENGQTPTALQPFYLDPLGRTVQISVRKLF